MDHKNIRNRNLPEPSPYEDILYLPHPVSGKHPRMPAADRAAQFAPFAALTGHGEIIKETEKQHISDDMEAVDCEDNIWTDD